MKSIYFGVAVFLFTSADCVGQFAVFGTAGAGCVVTHAKKTVNEFVMPYPGGGMRPPDGTLIDDLPSGHLAAINPELHSIVITCSKNGFKTRSVTLSARRTRWFSTVAPCGAPEGSTPAQIEAICGDYNRGAARDSSGWTTDYPAAHIRLEREDKK